MTSKISWAIVVLSLFLMLTFVFGPGSIGIGRYALILLTSGVFFNELYQVSKEIL
ncbi:hypothetical protein UFOVP75_195 [uncultured Caudovirales phage]|uniref:Uncharacterized protein n=1 Tax=uncultured Caudovirales phage TaxID=2100421 RepID=A0A6J5L1C5_9CAUD|nr:hypothetical protein UFOVP75_195 [uncultured Caudovirales phage]